MVSRKLSLVVVVIGGSVGSVVCDSRTGERCGGNSSDCQYAGDGFEFDCPGSVISATKTMDGDEVFAE